MANKKEENLRLIQELAMGKEEYRELLWEHEELNGRMLEAMEEMREDQRSAVEDYLGLVAQMGNFLLNMACENLEFSPGR